ncbi:hypothetical protein HPP92_021268 [Vanilla planifolia]|uniref:Uncharacterized protein n=1 Tax=Vanilla planifolia TaxID=51239 RepID=A0A835Q7M9_VANPL|nr:hypothetical protein HPP92_021268 [Vanilla planifolia]
MKDYTLVRAYYYFNGFPAAADKRLFTGKIDQLTMKLHGFLYFLVVSFQLVHSIPHNFTSLFSFGDSLADTGNFLRTGAVTFPLLAAFLTA